ncbi:MAG: ThiF family adenylyltransferase [Pirellulaceae bacterium]
MNKSEFRIPKSEIFIDDDRYSRFRLISWWDQEKLARARVLVVGAGALGNEVLKNLALLGIGFVWVVDFDQIEASNLTRSVLFRQRDCGRPKAQAAAESLRDLNPDTQVLPLESNIMTEIGLGLFRDADVVIGCLDNREARLWVNRQCWKVGTPWIDGGIQEISGVVKVFVPPDSACYECAMTENDYRLINLRYSCPLLRQEDLLAGKVPTAPTIASMIGGLQTQEALKLIHGMPVAAGEALIYNGVGNRFYNTAFQRRNDCLSHDTYPDPWELPLSAARHTVRELFAAVRQCTHIANGPMRLQLDRDLVVSIDCPKCETSRRIMRPRSAVAMDEALCKGCGQLAKPIFIHRIEEDSAFGSERLSDVGIPPYDILRVDTPKGESTFLLAEDRESAMGGRANLR